jgi:hypothetical protein
MDSTLPLIRRLNDHGVEFVVIGGLAAIAHGSARLTYDVDVCASMGQDNVRKIITALADLHPKWRMRPDLPTVTLDSPQLRGIKNIYLKTDLGQIDLLGEVDGVGDYDAVVKASVPMTLDRGLSCRVLELDALIIAKHAANRPKDRVAVVELEVIRERNKRMPPAGARPPPTP